MPGSELFEALGPIEVRRAPSDPEVCKSRTVLRTEHVLRLDVAMENAGIVGCSEGIGYLHAGLDGVLNRERAGRPNAIGDRSLLEELHHHVGKTVIRCPGAVHSYDVRVLSEVGRDLSFPAEPPSRRVVRIVREESLYSDPSVELIVVAAVNGARCAATDDAEVAISGDHRVAAGARSSCHTLHTCRYEVLYARVNTGNLRQRALAVSLLWVLWPIVLISVSVSLPVRAAGLRLGQFRHREAVFGSIDA